MQLRSSLQLYAPFEFWTASQSERKANCNGCGSELDLSGKLVPNTMYGLDVRIACCIHDWMYAKGSTLADKLFADAIFLLNLSLLIIDGSSLLTMPLRLLRASKYFVAVVKAGEESFFYNKSKNKEMYITFKGTFKEVLDV